MNQRIYNLKGGNPWRELIISINFGVLEYWSVGVMTKGLMPFFQHSNTPSLQGREFQELLATFKLPFYLS
jgi:hypothetical protein